MSETSIHPLRPTDPPWLGSYRVTGRIGRGGMGVVYLAESASGERAAVKVISPDLADDETFRNRFRSEVESARRVRRFCTAPVLDAELDGETLYIVTEYVDGPNLEEFVRANGPMRGAGLEHLAVGVATALTAIHGAGVIHRDMKPANVLLSSMGPRVIDFGIARALDGVSQATRTGQFIGTPAYMAPELISGGTASTASDVFAWGCVVAFAGTGRVPFEATTMPAVLYQITEGEPNLDGLDEALVGLVRQALAKDPRRRPSAQQVLDSLVGQAGADTQAAAATLSRAWTGGPTRHDTRVVAPGPAARRRRPGRRGWVIAAATACALIASGVTTAMMLRGSDGPPTKTSSIFADDFSNTDTGWDGGQFTSGDGYSNGRYIMQADNDTTIRDSAAPIKATSPARMLVTADETTVSGPVYGQFGLYCRGNADTSGTGYHFLVRFDGQGAVITKQMGTAGNKQLASSIHADGFRAHRSNHIQAACDASGTSIELKLWLNGTLTAHATDTDHPLPTGTSGLTVENQNGGSNATVTADFDNFDLSQIK